jgi:hypothetical protein
MPEEAIGRRVMPLQGRDPDMISKIHIVHQAASDAPAQRMRMPSGAPGLRVTAWARGFDAPDSDLVQPPPVDYCTLPR